MKKEEVAEPQDSGPSLEAFPDCSAIRTSQGIALKDLSNATRIRLSYLDAIEKGTFGKLPEPIYAQTFIKVYAEAIGVDTAILMAHYRAYLEKSKTVLPEVASGKRKEMSVPDLGRQASFGKPFKALGWIVSIVIVGAFLVSFFSTHMNIEDQREWIQPVAPAVPVNPPAVVAPAVPDAASSATVPGEVAPAAAPAQVAPTSYKLLIEATDTSWVSIVEDDRPPFEVLLRAGERLEREASKKFNLDVGNAGGVMVTFQGKSLGRLGQKGQVVHLTLPEDGQQ